MAFSHLCHHRNRPGGDQELWEYIYPVGLFLLIVLAGCSQLPPATSPSTSNVTRAVFAGRFQSGAERGMNLLGALTLGDSSGSLNLANGQLFAALAESGLSSFTINRGAGKLLHATGKANSAGFYSGSFSVTQNTQEVATGLWSALVIRSYSATYAFLTDMHAPDYSGALVLLGNNQGQLLEPDGSSWQVGWMRVSGPANGPAAAPLVLTVHLDQRRALVCIGSPIKNGGSVQGYAGNFVDPASHSNRICNAQILTFTTR